MFNVKLIAVTHDNKPRGKGGRKGSVNKPETFPKSCVSITQREGNGRWFCQFRVAKTASAGHVLCWETTSTRKDEHYIHKHTCVHT